VDLLDRLARKVERVGDHDVWRGATNTTGVPVVKVDGKLKTVRRVVCELAAGGSLPDGAKVDACPADPLCVRSDHLQVSGAVVGSRDRARKGSGSVSEVRPGVFKLSVVAGRHSDGTVRRSFRTVRGTRTEAVRALADFVAEVGDGSALPGPASKATTLDDLMRAYIGSCATTASGGTGSRP
jgi:hypothetical protein